MPRVSTAAAFDGAPYGGGARNCDMLVSTKGVTVLPHCEASAKPPVPKKSKAGVLNGGVNW